MILATSKSLNLVSPPLRTYQTRILGSLHFLIRLFSDKSKTGMGTRSCLQQQIVHNLPKACSSSYVLSKSRLQISKAYAQSQTQCGRRYTPCLTRFYAKLGPGILMPLICEALDTMGVKHRTPDMTFEGVLRVRIGGYDKRKLLFKGWIELEEFMHDDVVGSFCLMQRDQVCRPCRNASS